MQKCCGSKGLRDPIMTATEKRAYVIIVVGGLIVNPAYLSFFQIDEFRAIFPRFHYLVMAGLCAGWLGLTLVVARSMFRWIYGKGSE